MLVRASSEVVELERLCVRPRAEIEWGWLAKRARDLSNIIYLFIGPCIAI